MNGFLNILKPPGMTSAAVVAVIRRLSGEKRVGHAGTLDPEAAGVLPIMIGKAARLFDVLVDKEKIYVSECAFGCSTDTQDATGRILVRSDRYPTFEQIQAAAVELTGDIEQRPGIYSAIKQGGTPLYELARKGIAAEAPLRTVHVEKIELHGETPDHGVLMTVTCGRGTYIRSICEDLGIKTGCPAHMRFLLRAKSGWFDLDTAHTLEEVTAWAADGTLQEHLIPSDAPIGHLPSIEVPVSMAKQVRCGAVLPIKTDFAEGQLIRVYMDHAFWGLVQRQQNELRWRCQMTPETGEQS